MKRSKFVKEPAEGTGKCPGTWDVKRLQYKKCNMKRCIPPPGKVMQCSKAMDVILMLDGCPKSGKKGWDAQMKAVTAFVDAFDPAMAEMAVISFCGPRTWSGVSKCTGKSTKKIDTEKVCKIKIVSHFTNDLKKTKSKIQGLQMQKGMKLMSLGLLAATAELALGRKTVKSSVVAFIDGPPLSPRKTKQAAKILRKASRLTFVATTGFSPLKLYKSLVTRRWQENLVVVPSADDLMKHPGTFGTHVVANICPMPEKFEHGMPYACGQFDSGDCKQEYKNAVNNGNTAGFCRRCATEGGASPLRKRCSLCCTKCRDDQLK